MDSKFIEGVLLRCTILGVAVLLIWFSFLLVGRGLIHSVHGSLFGNITNSQFDIIHYCGLGLTKIFVFTFFFIPYVAMRWTDKNQK
jgi:hypothetical protein